MVTFFFVQADDYVDLNLVLYLYAHMHTVNSRAALVRKAGCNGGYYPHFFSCS